MSNNAFYKDFEFTNLVDLTKQKKGAGLEELVCLGVDKVYFSGDYPAILFKEIEQFDDAALHTIAHIQHLTWNYRKVMFLFVISKTEIRIYNCSKKPFNYENTDLKLADELETYEVIKSEFQNLQTLKTIKELFSRVAVDSGALWVTENKLKHTISVQDRIDKYLVKSLLNVARELKILDLPEDVIHSLLMRSIFIMYLEDKGAAKETNLYKNILQSANSYLDILGNKHATYKIFKKVEDHFNGNVFPLAKGEERIVNNKHLSLIKNCLFDGDLSTTPKLFEQWRLFRFDIIQIELLSEIYENFLEEFKEKTKEESGQYYTPPALVELILNEKLKVGTEKKWEVKVLDPACGSGIFLVESFKRLVKRWKNAHPNDQIKFSDLRDILEKNIFGIEYDRLAIRVTAFSLYLALLEFLNPRTLWIDKRYRFPYLIADPSDKTLEKQGKNLVRQDSIGEVSAGTFGEIDLLVGNPPFGAKINLPSIKKYCVNYNFGQDMVIPFLHKAVLFAPKGSIALIFNTKVLTNSEGTFRNFREWLFDKTYVEKIYNFSIYRKAPKTFGGQLFSSAVGPVSILFYQKEKPKRIPANIEYWAPKSYIKTNLVEGIVIDGADIKFLPRQECKKADTNIWKIAMWGTLEDFSLIEKLRKNMKLSEFLDTRKLTKGLGFQFISNVTKTPLPDSDIPKLPYIKAENINRFYSGMDDFCKLTDDITESSITSYKKLYKIDGVKPLRNINHFNRLGQKEVFYGPHLLIKKGLSNKKVCASYVDIDCTFNSKVLGIVGGSRIVLKSLAAILNSSLATYYLFLISSSIGIEREEIQTREIYNLPIRYDENIFRELASVVDSIKARISKNSPMIVDINDLEKNINKLVYDLFELSYKERILVDDFMKYSVSLLFEGHKSVSLKSITTNENKSYASTLCDELTKFLGSNTSFVNASVFNIHSSSPLNIVKISFHTAKVALTVFDNQEFNRYLEEINRYSITHLAKNIYIQKQLRYYDDNDIYIIKPNQKRFWSRSAAMNDSRELINEILKMS